MTVRSQKISNAAGTASSGANHKLPLFPWRLAKGVRIASDAALHTEIERCGRGELFCAVLVGVGLLLEVLIALANPEYDSPVETWGPVVSDAFVFIGVVGEYLVGSRASTCQEELTRRSNDRLAEAERQSANAQGMAAQASWDAESANAAATEATDRLAEVSGRLVQATNRLAETESRLAGRRVTSEMATLLGEVLAEEKPASVVFTFAEGDHEANIFAGDLGVVFTHWGWKTYFQPSAYAGKVEYAVRVPLYSNSLREDVARSIRAAFGRANILYRTTPPVPTRWYEEGTVSEPSCEVYIGPRPPLDIR